MCGNITSILDNLIERYPALSASRDTIFSAYSLIEASYHSGGKLLVAGNGGSAADAEHIVGELMKGFLLPRRISDKFAKSLMGVDAAMGKELATGLQGALPAIALDGHFALNTAFGNDCNPQLTFAQQVLGYGHPEDVLLGISTSGGSRNVLYAAVTARAKGMKVIGLTGQRESPLSAIADVCICVPETETYRVQELHLPVYHCLCAMLEERFFNSGNINEI